MISFGPFLSRSPEQSRVLPKVESTGFVLEFSSAHQGVRVPIYRRKERTGDDWHDYLFCVQDAPVALRYHPYDSVQTELGLFVGLEGLIAAIYSDRQVARPLVDFLDEFRASLPLKKNSIFPKAYPQAAFKPELTSLGFYLIDLFSYGRAITGSVGWYCQQDRDRVEAAPYFCAGALEFRPRPDATLNPGRWLEPVPGHLISLLRDILRRATPGPPVNLLSEEGKKIILESFKWTKVARMTNKEARQARIEFAKMHPELLEKPKELALAMRKAQLYSEGTALGNILEHLDTIVAAAKGLHDV